MTPGGHTERDTLQGRESIDSLFIRLTIVDPDLIRSVILVGVSVLRKGPFGVGTGPLPTRSLLLSLSVPVSPVRHDSGLHWSHRTNSSTLVQT